MRRLTTDERSRPTYVNDPTKSATEMNTATSANCRFMGMVDSQYSTLMIFLMMSVPMICSTIAPTSIRWPSGS